MKFLQDRMGNLFVSQDSKYFLSTAFKMTMVPVFFFSLLGYSIWNLMELNFNFFVANGFDSGEGFKEVFYQTIFGDISEYSVYLVVLLGTVFMSGILVSYLALRPFWHVEKHVSKMLDGSNDELKVEGLNKNKLFYRVSRIFLKFLDITRTTGNAPKIRLPADLERLSSPKLDKVFMLQYACVVTAICMICSFALISFTSEFYQQIVDNSSQLLAADQVVTTFVSEEMALLEKITNMVLLGMIFGYLLISKNIISAVDGVSYGFARDMLRVVNGEEDVKLRPRYADPGKSFAVTVNDFLDIVYPYEEDIQELSYDSLPEELDEVLAENVIKNDFQFDESQIADSQITEIEAEADATAITEVDHRFHEEEDFDLPPSFIQESQDPEGNKVFKITTPTGQKFENLSEDMAIKVVMEIENQKKAG